MLHISWRAIAADPPTLNRHKMMVQWLVTFLMSALVYALREQKFGTEPQNQTAVVGSRVTLPCRVINKSGQMQWTKDGFGLGNLSGFDRYSIIGDEEEGEYTLEISPVTIDDDAPYRCQVGAGAGGEPPAISRVANLTVLVPPETPKIIQGTYITTKEDRDIELECVSANGKPPAEVSWIDGKGNLVRKDVENIIDPISERKTYTTRSILRIKVKREHHNTTFTCQAKNKADQNYRTARLKLEVKFAPKVNVLIIGNGSRLVEGQDVRLTCSATANPPQVSYRWYVNNQLMLSDFTTELEIKTITRDYHKSVVSCEVNNLEGRGEQSVTLDVSYGPRFRVKPYSVQADTGASVTLTCQVEGNPPPSIVWIHEDSARVVSTSPNLTLTVAHDTAGRYFCRATVTGFPDIKAEATVYMKGPPTIISHRTQYGIPGDDVRLECSAFSIPTPQKVIWSFKGEDVNSGLDYSVLEDLLTEGIKSTLIIRESRLEHFGVYNCTVSNPYGSDVVEITLKAQKSFPMHTTVFGVIGGIVVIITLSMLVMMCQRKAHKTHDRYKDIKKESKNNKESDVSSNLSDMKLEIEYSGEGSETGSERADQGTGLPLAGPVPISMDHRSSQRYSIAEYSDPLFPPKNTNQNNNGYFPYVDYARDYSPPAPLPMGVSSVPQHPRDISLGSVDPRYSAVYGNPYLRHSLSSQLPPPPVPNPSVGPPPYNVNRNPSPSRLHTQQNTVNINKNTVATHV